MVIPRAAVSAHIMEDTTMNDILDLLSTFARETDKSRLDVIRWALNKDAPNPQSTQAKVAAAFADIPVQPEKLSARAQARADEDKITQFLLTCLAGTILTSSEVAHEALGMRGRAMGTGFLTRVSHLILAAGYEQVFGANGYASQRKSHGHMCRMLRKPGTVIDVKE